MSGHVWTGRRGPVILGPTEHRVALGLDQLTRRGRIRLRTVDLAARYQLERSEAYRITRRLRILGLFGIANDPSGSRGGRWWWRTAAAHDGSELDPERHRVAWARVVGFGRRLQLRATQRLHDLRAASAQARAHPAPAVPSPRPREPFPLRRYLLELAPELARAWELE
jgi:hypothetical protein